MLVGNQLVAIVGGNGHPVHQRRRGAAAAGWRRKHRCWSTSARGTVQHVAGGRVHALPAAGAVGQWPGDDRRRIRATCSASTCSERRALGDRAALGCGLIVACASAAGRGRPGWRHRRPGARLDLGCLPLRRVAHGGGSPPRNRHRLVGQLPHPAGAQRQLHGAGTPHRVPADHHPECRRPLGRDDEADHRHGVEHHRARGTRGGGRPDRSARCAVHPHRTALYRRGPPEPADQLARGGTHPQCGCRRHQLSRRATGRAVVHPRRPRGEEPARRVHQPDRPPDPDGHPHGSNAGDQRLQREVRPGDLRDGQRGDHRRRPEVDRARRL